MKTLTGWTLLVALTLSAPALYAGGDAAAGGEKTKSKGCVQCHGADGNSPTPSAIPGQPQPPILAGQHADYLVRALEDYTTGARQSPFMAGFAATLTDEDREDIAAFYASQDPALKTVKFEH